MDCTSRETSLPLREYLMYHRYYTYSFTGGSAWKILTVSVVSGMDKPLLRV